MSLLWSDMSILLLTIFISIVFFHKSYAVGIDYLESEIIDNDLTNASNDSGGPRRVGDSLKVDEYEDEAALEDDKFTLYLARKPQPAMFHATTASKPTATEIDVTDAQPTTPRPSTELNIFTDYDYSYEDASPSVLRDNSKVMLFHQIPTYVDNVTKVPFKDRNMLSELYNIEPAAALFNFKTDIKIDSNVKTSVWYVPEKYPCWDLPLLYGEMGPKDIHSRSDVFLIHRGTLINVIDDDMERESEPKNFYKDVNVNKWCGIAPCYADHVLCLYPTKTLSKICYDGYRVRVPTMLKQVALVNTLNSMRNHVAKGSRTQYPFLPPAANMKQILYDYDLEKMAKAWLRQCLPGSAPCAALDTGYVSQLECTKYMMRCCIGASSRDNW